MSKVIRNCIGFALLCFITGPGKLGPFSQPIRCQTKTNCDSLTHVFPRPRQISHFTLRSHWYFPFLRLVVVITLVLFLRHSIEECCNSYYEICTLRDTKTAKFVTQVKKNWNNGIEAYFPCSSLHSCVLRANNIFFFLSILFYNSREKVRRKSGAARIVGDVGPVTVSPFSDLIFSQTCPH